MIKKSPRWRNAQAIRDAEERQRERRDQALRAAAEWEHGIPLAQPWGIGAVYTLEREGLLQRAPERDRMGDLRWTITPAGLEAIGAGQ